MVKKSVSTKVNQKVKNDKEVINKELEDVNENKELSNLPEGSLSQSKKPSDSAKKQKKGKKLLKETTLNTEKKDQGEVKDSDILKTNEKTEKSPNRGRSLDKSSTRSSIDGVAKASNEDEKEKEKGLYQKLPKDWLIPGKKSYKAWAQSCADDTYVKCSWCDTELLVDCLYGSKGHLKSPAQVAAQKAHENKHPNIIEEPIEIKDIEKKTVLFEYDMLNTLIKLASPFSDVEPWLKVVKKHCKSDYVQNSKLNRKKAAEMIKNDIQGFCVSKLKDKLRKTYFSLIIDEATDNTKKKYLAVMVHYWEETEVSFVNFFV